jgi:hypothetical protein
MLQVKAVWRQLADLADAQTGKCSLRVLHKLSLEATSDRVKAVLAQQLVGCAGEELVQYCIDRHLLGMLNG